MIKSRISQKVDTTENWNNQPDFVPLKGEIVVYDDGHGDKQRLKIGDGTNKIGDLKFLNNSNTNVYYGVANAIKNESNPNTYSDFNVSCENFNFEQDSIIFIAFSAAFSDGSIITREKPVWPIRFNVNGAGFKTVRYMTDSDVSVPDDGNSIRNDGLFINSRNYCFIYFGSTFTLLSPVGLDLEHKTDNANYQILFYKDSLNGALIRKINSNSNITVNPATKTISANISGNAGGLSVTLPVTSGGTGKTTFTKGNFLVGNGTNALSEVSPDDLLSKIGAGKFTASTTDLTAGVSPLAEGEVYLVYE